MALLKHPDRKINIPRLQPNPPTTEDMLMRREREMTALGGGEEGRKARLKMQSRLLEMDMRDEGVEIFSIIFLIVFNIFYLSKILECFQPRPKSAFKASNQGATFEDFVRWHSPSDWSPEEGLSQRMTLPGNVWVDLWADSGPIPVMGFSNRCFINCFFLIQGY